MRCPLPGQKPVHKSHIQPVLGLQWNHGKCNATEALYCFRLLPIKDTSFILLQMCLRSALPNPLQRNLEASGLLIFFFGGSSGFFWLWEGSDRIRDLWRRQFYSHSCSLSSSSSPRESKRRQSMQYLKSNNQIEHGRSSGNNIFKWIYISYSSISFYTASEASKTQLTSPKLLKLCDTFCLFLWLLGFLALQHPGRTNWIWPVNCLLLGLFVARSMGEAGWWKITIK